MKIVETPSCLLQLPKQASVRPLIGGSGFRHAPLQSEWPHPRRDTTSKGLLGSHHQKVGERILPKLPVLIAESSDGLQYHLLDGHLRLGTSCLEVIGLRSNHHPCFKVKSLHVVDHANSIATSIDCILGLEGAVCPPQHLIEERRESNHLRSAGRHDRSHLFVKTRGVKHI
jgi:hypothetical protein